MGNISGDWNNKRGISSELVSYVLFEKKSKLLHDVLAEQDRQELVVRDMLDLSDDDPPRLLVQGLVVPVRIQLQQRLGDSIMLARHQGVHAG